MKLRIGSTMGMALAIGVSAAALTAPAAQAAQPAQPAQPAQAAQTAQTAAKAACGGSLIERKVARYKGKPIAELVVYYSNGRNCARVNHLGATRGKKLQTGVLLAACKQKRPSKVCDFLGGPVTDEGKFAHYAGPVRKRAKNRCIHAAGYIDFHGRHFLRTTPAASHCR